MSLLSTHTDATRQEDNLGRFFNLLFEIDRRQSWSCYTPEIWTPLLVIEVK